MDPAKRSRENFCLAVDGWTEIEEDKENTSPPAKQRRMSLSLPKDKSRKTRTTATTASTSTSISRWSFLSETEEAIITEKCVPRNTAYSTEWAVSTFSTWAKNRNTAFPGIPDKLVNRLRLPSSCPIQRQIHVLLRPVRTLLLLVILLIQSQCLAKLLHSFHLGTVKVTINNHYWFCTFCVFCV